MVKEIDNIQDKVNWHWRNSMYPVRAFSFDARAFFTFPLLFFYARLSTLILLIINVALFWFMEQKGLTFPAAIRAIRSWVVGKDRPAWSSVYKKKFKDMY